MSIGPQRPRRLVLVRHGATVSNERGRFQGWGDGAMTEAGVRAVGRTARWLAGHVSPAQVWSSDLRRCRQTARLLFPRASLELDPRLRELAFGAFEGRSHAELLQSENPAYRAWLRDPDRCPPPGGERLSALRARVLAWWEERVREERTGGCAVITHGGPAGILLAHLLDPGDPVVLRVPEPGGCLHLSTHDRVPFRWRLIGTCPTSPREP